MGLCQEKPSPNPQRVDMSHFKLMNLIGQGGFGRVYAVKHHLSGELMAMKMISKARIIQNKQFSMLRNEMNFMLRLKSPFLMSLSYVFTTETDIIFVMPLMLCGSLQYHIDRKKNSEFGDDLQVGFSEEIVRLFCCDMILALEAMHREFIVNRDIKPANILLDKNGHVHIADFGLSVQLKDAKDKTVGRAGTVGFMAPEVASGMRYGLEADFYSFGATVYLLLNGTMYDRRRKSSLREYNGLSSTGVDFVSRLLLPRKSRLGVHRGWIELKEHKWLEDIDWSVIEKREGYVGFSPYVGRPGVDNFEREPKERGGESVDIDGTNYDKEFAGLEYNTKLEQTGG